MGPADLSDALAGLAPPSDPNLLVGYETADDASVYRLSDELAVISTVDFITPPVDDAYWFGLIAAANSISDVYAMGGRPLTALNLVMFPTRHLDLGMLRDILRGGRDKAVEAGVSLAGGHSVEDEEPKYGLCVNGTVHPERIVTNAGARPGDAIILTKPLGTGVLFNAVRSGRMPYPEVEREVLPSVGALNGPAMEQALSFELHAATDVTGFGIAGHLFEIARASGVTIRLRYSSLPLYPGALEMYRRGEDTGSNLPNRRMVEEILALRIDLSKAEEQILFDPQTSGGLLLAVPEGDADGLVVALEASGVTTASRIGEVAQGPPGLEVI